MDRNAASSLGMAGEAATQTLSAQTAAAQRTVARLDQYWGVRDTLLCVRTRPALRAACLKNVSTTPQTEVARQVAGISDALTRRRKALDALNRAYETFVELSRYDAGQAATAALKTSFEDVNAFTSAAAALTPGGVAAPPIRTTVEKLAGGGVAIYANARQDRLIVAANADLETADEALYGGLDRERLAVDGLLQTLSAEQSGLVRAGYDAGLISAPEILTPVFQQAGADVALTPPPPANADVVDAAAHIVMAGQASSQRAAASQSYDDALSALKDVAAQHARLSRGETPNLAAIEDQIADLRSDLSAMSATPSRK